jgi:hypothetical protein
LLSGGCARRLFHPGNIVKSYGGTFSMCDAYTAPGGRLVAIMGEGLSSRKQGRRGFRLAGRAGEREPPDGSFMDPSLPVNTSVAARMVVIDKPTTPAAGDSDTRFRRQELLMLISMWTASCRP